MSIENTNDANTTRGPSPSVSAPQQSAAPASSPGNMKPTFYEEGVQDPSSAQTLNEGQPQGETSDTQAQTKEPPFHEHPRWIERQAKFDQAINRLQDLLAQRETAQQQPKQEQLDFTNILDLSDEQIVEWEQTDKKGLYANILRQARHEVRQDAIKDVMGQLSQRDKNNVLLNSLRAFGEKNKGFNDLLQSGKLKSFCDANPGHNVFSAYHEITLKDQIDRARKDERETINSNLKAKGAAGSIQSQTSGARISTGRDPRLDNPEKYGGAEAVAIARAAERMANRQFQ